MTPLQKVARAHKCGASYPCIGGEASASASKFLAQPGQVDPDYPVSDPGVNVQFEDSLSDIVVTTAQDQAAEQERLARHGLQRAAEEALFAEVLGAQVRSGRQIYAGAWGGVGLAPSLRPAAVR